MTILYTSYEYGMELVGKTAGKGELIMYSSEIIERIRVQLSDSDQLLFSNSDLQACIDRAVSDLSRWLPDKKVFEDTVKLTITNEATVAPANNLVAVSLVNQMIKPESELITNAAGTVTYTRDKDYVMDYANGQYKTKSGGSIVASSNLLATYTKLEIGCDISSIIDSLIAVEKVVYPAGDVPTKSVGYDLWGTYLTIKTGSTASQGRVVEGKHIQVYYKSEQLAPTENSNGSYPLFLDSVVQVGAEAYAIYLRVAKLMNDLLDEIDVAKSAVDDMTDIDAFLIAATDALVAGAACATDSNIATYLGNAITALTAGENCVVAITTQLTAVESSITTGKGYLTSGAALLNLANKGSDVALNYQRYASAINDMASNQNRETEAILSKASYDFLHYVNDAEQKVQAAMALVAKMNYNFGHYVEAASQNINAAVAKFQSVNAIAEKYQAVIPHKIDIIARMIAQADQRKADFWNILNDKLQLHRPTFTVSERQLPQQSAG